MNIKHHFSYVILLIALTICPLLTKAQTLETQAMNSLSNIHSDDEKEEQSLPSFAQWGDNEIYADYNRSLNTTEHFDASLGFRYLLLNATIPKENDWDYTVAIAYEGTFDFFAGTRESGPVVSTKNNPSIFAAFIRNPKYHKFTGAYLSLEHESNGQVSNSNEDLRDVERSFRRDYREHANITDQEFREMALQTISRSNNFVALGLNIRSHRWDDAACLEAFSCFNFFGEFRYQLNTGLEDSIFWQNNNENIRLKQYQGTRLQVDTTFSAFDVKQSFRFDVSTGQIIDGNAFKNVTYDFRYYIDAPAGKLFAKLGLKSAKNFTIPFVFLYHNGYVEELYNYSEKNSFWVLGLHARY